MKGTGRYIIGALISFGIALIFLAAGSSAAYFDALEETKAEAHIIAQNARAMGADESDPVILGAKEIWHEAQNKIDYELDMIARVVYFEAGSSWLSQRRRELVAAVLINRCFDTRFPDTVEENIYRKGQYACAGRLYSVTREQIPDYCYSAAYNAAYGLVECPAGVIFQAQFKQGAGVYEKHGNTYFCFG